MSRSTTIRDARTLLGMDTRAAWAIAGFYLCAEFALAVSSWQDVDSRPAVLAALGLTVAATVALLVARPDPLPPLITAVLAASIPLTTATVLAVLPVPATPAQLWPFGAGTVTATFLCVRGRAPAAWLGLCAMIGVSAGWSALTGQGVGHGVAISIINLGPLLMSTFFAYTIRPAAHEIFQLHEQSVHRTASAAAATAVLQERREQLVGMDQLVRPILERIAGPDPLDEDDRAECRFVEAHLRDTLRAPALAVAPVAAAAREARRRGVEVVLADDGGLDEATEQTRTRLLALVRAELGAARSGTVTVRILPPRRPLLATMVVRDPDTGMRRVEIDTAGTALHDTAGTALDDTTETALADTAGTAHDATVGSVHHEQSVGPPT